MRGTRIGMRRVACLAAVGVLLLSPTHALAEHDNGYGEHPTFDRSPDRGPQGTVIKLWGTGCIYRGAAWEKADVSFRSLAKKADGTPLYYLISGSFPVKDDGSWEGELVVPQEAPTGDYILRAKCWASDMGLDAGEQPFTVANIAPSTTSTTAVPTTTTTTAPPKALPAGATTTTSLAAAGATTTTKSAPPASAPTDKGQQAATPAASVPDDEDRGGGPPWGLAALVGATAAGAVATWVLRRRRMGEADRPG